MLVDNLEIRILCCRQECLSRWNHPNLCAPYWRFYWNQIDGASVRLEDERISLNSQTALIISPNTPFSSHSSGPTEQFYLHFLVGGAYERTDPGLFPCKITQDLQVVLNSVRQVISGDKREIDRISVFCQYIVAFAVMQVPINKLGHPPTDLRVNQAILYINNNLSELINNKKLARMAGMNINSFIRLFKAQIGLSPHSYLLSKRIEKAAFMLRASAKSIEEITINLGFSDRYHFSKTFKNRLGMSPAAFRRARE